MSKLSISDVILMTHFEKERRKQNIKRISRGEYNKKEQELIDQYYKSGVVPMKKRPFVSLFLVLIFGSIGFMYISFKRGLILFFLQCFFIFFIPVFGIGLALIMRLVMIFMASFMVYNHNERVQLLFRNSKAPFYNHYSTKNLRNSYLQ